MTTLVFPETQAELEDMLLDAKVKAQLASDPTLMGQYQVHYQRAVAKADPDMQRRINEMANEQVTKILDGERPKLLQEAKEEVQRELAHGLRNAAAGKDAKTVKRLDLSGGHNHPAVANGLGRPGWGARNALYNQNAPGARIDEQELFSNPAEFLQAIHHAPHTLPGSSEVQARRAQALEALLRIKNDYSSTVPADGGFLIPETMRSDVMAIALEQSITRPRATVIPMETLSTLIPGVDSTSNASSVFGGIVCYWTEEGAALVESQGKFRRVRLEAKKLTAYSEVPNELVADATAFGAFFSQAYPKAIAWYEDDGFITGSGVGEPFGWLNSAAAVSVAKESGQAADTILWENIVKAYARMLPSSLGNAVWVVSIDAFPELATMALSVGTGGSAIWLNNGVAGPPMTILGRPVVFTEKTPVVGDAGDVNFVDLSYYAIGDRQAMQAEASGHFKFQNDATAYRFIQRVDGRPLLESAITPKNGGSTLSPFVKVAARA